MAPASDQVTLPGRVSSDRYAVPAPDAGEQQGAGETATDSEPASDTLHVRGIGVHGWDGTKSGRGEFENEEALKEIFSSFGPCVQVTIRHRIRTKAGVAHNMSWALVQMETIEAADAALAAECLMAGAEPLVVTRYSKKIAASSTGGMQQVRMVMRSRADKKNGSSKLLLDLRHEARQKDAIGLERDKQLHPHMLEAEIKSLGWLFDEYAEGSSNDLYIDRTAVQRMLDEALEDLYNKLDSDRSGTLDKSEIKALLNSLGVPTTSAEIRQLMTDLDADGDEKVGLREFMGWWEHRQYETRENQDRELEDLFKAVDNDGSGRIDWEEFLNLVS